MSLAPFAAGLGDALGVRVEVVACLQVGAYQVDDLGIGVVGARPVRTGPELVAGAAGTRADVRVRVVAVYPPAGEHPLGEPVLSWPAEVHHDLVLASFGDGGPDPPGERVEGLVPADPLPGPRASGAVASQRVQDAIRIGHLVQGGRALGAIAAPRARVLGIALELAHLKAVAVHIGEQAAGRLAVKARRGDEEVVMLAPRRPGTRVKLGPVVPALLWGKGRQVGPARSLVEGFSPRLHRRACRRDPRRDGVELAVGEQFGT